MLNALPTGDGKLDRLVRMVLARPKTFLIAVISLGLASGLVGAMLSPAPNMCMGTYDLASISAWH